MHRSVCIKSQNIYKRGIFLFIFYNRGKSNGELELAVCFIRAVVCKQQVYLRSVNQTKKKKKTQGKKKPCRQCIWVLFSKSRGLARAGGNANFSCD